MVRRHSDAVAHLCLALRVAIGGDGRHCRYIRDNTPWDVATRRGGGAVQRNQTRLSRIGDWVTPYLEESTRRRKQQREATPHSFMRQSARTIFSEYCSSGQWRERASSVAPCGEAGGIGTAFSLKSPPFDLRVLGLSNSTSHRRHRAPSCALFSAPPLALYARCGDKVHGANSPSRADTREYRLDRNQKHRYHHRPPTPTPGAHNLNILLLSSTLNPTKDFDASSGENAKWDGGKKARGPTRASR